MLYKKQIEEIKYEDVVNFCEEETRENINLDYKREISNESLAKTIAAMANTWGGIIIIGVDEEDSKPKLPVEGIDYKEKLKERINNIVIGRITPFLFLEIGVCEPNEDDKTFIIIRVPQSDKTPHAIKQNEKVYLRTLVSNDPEEKLAKVDKIFELRNRNNEASEMRLGLKKQSEKRYERVAERRVKAEEVGINQKSVFTFSAIPVFPSDSLCESRYLKNEIVNNVVVTGWRGSKIPIRFSAYQANTIKNGVNNLYVMSDSTDPKWGYVELNEKGLYFYKARFAKKKDYNGKIRDIIYLRWVLRRLDLLVKSTYKFYKKLGYWGKIEISLKLEDVIETDFIDFKENWKKPFDNQLSFTKKIQVSKLLDNKIKLTSELFSEIIWALGFEYPNKDRIKEIIEENN